MENFVVQERMARDIMSSPVRCVSRDATLAEAAGIMLEEGIGALLVLDAGGRVAGILTDSDFGSADAPVPFSTFRAPKLLDRWLGRGGVEAIYREARVRRVSEVMSSPVHCLREDASLRDVLECMMRRGIKHLPVLRGEVPVGMIARHDLLKLICPPRQR